MILSGMIASLAIGGAGVMAQNALEKGHTPELLPATAESLREEVDTTETKGEVYDRTIEVTDQTEINFDSEDVSNKLVVEGNSVTSDIPVNIDNTKPPVGSNLDNITRNNENLQNYNSWVNRDR